mmetsp:Transcript_28943/g.33095  ORF Transcript_28943/g.33095 Transcript_28943/m.33095 type:complete len:355 (-) Transcript_28943:287-1351(-)
MSEQDGNPPPTFQRYRRRCSVTRYSLDDMSPPTEVIPQAPQVEPNVITTTPTTTEESLSETATQETTTSSEQQLQQQQDLQQGQPPLPPHRRYQRRSSVTRYNLQQNDIRPQTKSLSPNPLKRRGSTTKYTVEQVSNKEAEAHQENTIAETTEVPEDTKKEFPARFRRRCSITKYSLNGATSDEEPKVVSFKLTVEEPMDTVEALEHRQMLANDTIESGGAGDLLIGWNNASADFLGNKDVTMANYGIETKNIIDSDITMEMKKTAHSQTITTKGRKEGTTTKTTTHIIQSINKKKPIYNNKKNSAAGVSTTIAETYGTYLCRFLRRNFVPTSLVPSLQSNPCNGTAVNANHVK